MKISNPTPNYINQTYTNQAGSKLSQPGGEPGARAGKPAEDPSGDSINLSSKTRELQKVSAAMDTEPLDRVQKVDELKKQVQANQYTVNAEQVAEKMVGSIMDGLI